MALLTQVRGCKVVPRLLRFSLIPSLNRPERVRMDKARKFLLHPCTALFTFSLPVCSPIDALTFFAARLKPTFLIAVTTKMVKRCWLFDVTGGANFSNKEWQLSRMIQCGHGLLDLLNRFTGLDGRCVTSASAIAQSPPIIPQSRPTRYYAGCQFAWADTFFEESHV